ncbi:MAG TPA: hypothetical protein VHN79_07950, partial [Lacunisphaera sp.]|nr:hypothetical protein [Lacunisphaera sp.]
MTLIFRLLRVGSLALLPLTVSLAAPSRLADFQAAAAKSGQVLALPSYPLTPEALQAKADGAIKEADAALTALAAQDPAKLTFANTFAAADAIVARVVDAALVVSTLAESSTDKAMRDTANELNVKLQEWSVGLDYREDVYRALKTVVDAKPKLPAEEQRLVDEMMRSYRRAGLSLPPAERAEVEKLRKDLAGLETQFGININEARGPLDFTAEELDGVPPSFLESPGIKQPDGRY